MNAPVHLRADASLQTPAFDSSDQPTGMLFELGSMSRRWQRVILLQTCALVFLAGVGTDRGFMFAPVGRGDVPAVTVRPVAIQPLPDIDATPGEISALAPLNTPPLLPTPATLADTQEPASASEATIGDGSEPTIWAVGVDEKNVRAVIARWCLAGGYTLEWSASVDYPVPASAKGHSYNGDLMAGIAGLAKTFGKLPTPLSIKFDPKSGVLHVASPAAPTKR